MNCFLKIIDTHWISATIFAASVVFIIWIICNRSLAKKKGTIKLVDMLMVTAFISIIILVIITAYKQPEDGSFDLAILTVSLAFGAIIPYIVGVSIARSEVNKIVDSKFKELENKYSTSLASLSKQNAHTKRMSANLLSDCGNIKSENKKWAIGWASEALISYCRIRHEYNGDKYIDECISLLQKLEVDWNKTDKEGSEETAINERTLRSLLTMHAYTKLKSPHMHINLVNKYLKLTETEKKLLKSLIEHNNSHLQNESYVEAFCRSCGISDLDDEEENDKIRSEIKNIINKELNNGIL